MFTTFSYLIKNTVRGYRTKSVEIDSHLQMKRSKLIIFIKINPVKTNLNNKISAGIDSVRNTEYLY